MCKVDGDKCSSRASSVPQVFLLTLRSMRALSICPRRCTAVSTSFRWTAATSTVESPSVEMSRIGSCVRARASSS